MDHSNLELTHILREALLAQPDSPVYISDQQTQKVYVLFEKGRFPELKEQFILDRLELAREQIRRGETSNATIEEVILKAKGRSAS